DIAPDNVLILPDETPLLLDFGAARRVIGDMTQALTVILKPGYAPIEQYAEVPNMKQGPWTDLYALASVVYFAITGSAPVPAVARVMSDPVVPLSQSAAGRYSDSFLRAIDKALSVRPEDRPQNIAEFRQALGFQERSAATRFVPTSSERRVEHGRDDPAAVGKHAAGAGKATPRNTKKIAVFAGIAAVVALIGGVVTYVALDEPLPGTKASTLQSNASVRDGAAPDAASAATLAAIGAKLGAFECARLQGTLDGSTATVRGHVSRDGDLQRISADLSGIAGVAAVNNSAVQVFPPPHCHVVSALAPYAGHPQTGPSIALKSGGTSLHAGDKVVTVVTAGDFAGYVYADLYDTEGNVAHMLPNSKEKNNRVDARQRLVLGEDPLFGVEWDVLPPFGKHLLVVMQSQSPLFGEGRVEVERAGAYLLGLREDLDRKPAAEKFVVHYTPVEFLPKK
ncbi:MAG TPA: DUF4384 domain-containing protein, partial [Burkholderiales bacterium]|nr:DUF4384 domain-containing protein [Burkholderiales bacterium]